MDVAVVPEPDDPLLVARRNSADGGGGGGGGGGGRGSPVPGDGVRTVGGTLVAVAVWEEEGEATRLGELVPMNWSAGTPAAFHLIPCG
jgi:hypothetical protein